MNHSDNVKLVWYEIMLSATNIFDRDVDVVDDPRVVQQYNRLSTADKTAIDNILAGNRMRMVEFDNKLLVGRTLL